MSLEVEMPKCDFSIPRSVAQFAMRFGWNQLDVSPDMGAHFWHLVGTMKEDREQCPDVLLCDLCWDWWKAQHARQENFLHLNEPPIKSSPAPKLTPKEKEEMPPSPQEVHPPQL